jgi:hypothetical protein
LLQLSSFIQGFCQFLPFWNFFVFFTTVGDDGSLRQYSGVKKDLPKAMILSATAGAINRGACVLELSQYPEEVCPGRCPWPLVHSNIAPCDVLIYF